MISNVLQCAKSVVQHLLKWRSFNPCTKNVACPIIHISAWQPFGAQFLYIGFMHACNLRHVTWYLFLYDIFVKHRKVSPWLHTVATEIRRNDACIILLACSQKYIHYTRFARERTSGADWNYKCVKRKYWAFMLSMLCWHDSEYFMNVFSVWWNYIFISTTVWPSICHAIYAAREYWAWK